MGNEELETKVEYLFKEPIHLNENVEIQEFNTKTKELDFLVIHDGRHYHLNKSLFNLIKTIEKYSTLEEIRIEYSRIQNEEYTPQDIEIAINEFLAKNGIVETIEPVELKKQDSYFYFKFRLLPPRILHPITNVLQHFFNPIAAKTLVFLIVSVHLLIFTSYISQGTFNSLINSPRTLLLTFLIFNFSIFFHEFGHISACRYFGAKYGDIGCGLYLRFPVLYADITDVWRLKGWQRAIIDVSGIYFQYIINIVLFLIYLFTKEIVFIYAIQAICIQTIFTLNPFFRFDGYWLATDLLNIPNLRKRAFEIVEYFITKYIKRKEVKNSIIFSMEKKSKYIFFIYAFISNTFFVYFMILMFFYLPKFLLDYPKYLTHSFHTISYSIKSSEWFNLPVEIFQLLMKTFLLALSIYFIYRMVIYAFKLIKKIFTTLLNS